MLTYLPQYCVLICCEHQHAVYSLNEHLKRRHCLPIAQRQALLATYERYSLCPPQQVLLPAPYSAPIAELGPAQDGFLCCQSKAVVAPALAALAAPAAPAAPAPAALPAPLAVAGGAEVARAEAAVEQQRASYNSSCSYITVSRKEMRKHTNQQHSVKLSRWSTPLAVSYAEHAAQLWRPVKVQTFFQERRYVRYFIVQETEHPPLPLLPLSPLSLERDRSQTSQQRRQEKV